MLNREDMNKYNTSSTKIPSQRTEGEFSQTAGATAKTVGGMVWKVIKTVLFIAAVTGLLVFISVASFILSFRNVEPPNISSMKLSYSSFIYLDGEEEQGEPYMALYSNENRVWVPLSEIPLIMQTAQIAIEDHRFYEHNGVDWKGTLGAMYKLLTHSGGGGGSTLTQQLIKNLTGEKQVSILRKVKEIFTALNLENGYTKDGERKVGYEKEEILEAYLNVVNYGGQCQGVEAAANYYFDKSISDCSLAECAMIAGITQNPWQYNPMIFLEDSKGRAKTVLKRMLELSEEGLLDNENLVSITKSEYDAAVAELETIKPVGAELEDTDAENEEKQDTEKWNWYIDVMFEDIVSDLMEKYNYSYDVAERMMYNGGYEIESSMNLKMQTDIENLFLKNTDMLPEDQAIELGFFMMDPYTGKVMAVVGNRGARSGIRLQNNATMSARQSGSAIKPISPYAVGLNTDTVTYGSVLKDAPIPEYSEDGDEWPKNYSREYEGSMNVDRAIEQSQNAPAAWLCKEVTPEACYDWLVNKLHFTTLTEEDSHSLSAMALGGQTNGVTVRDMTAAFQIYANGGVYHKPITYNYVKDHDGNVILDNRPESGDNQPEQVMSIDNATIMNKLLHRPIYGDWGTATGYMSGIDTEIYGKTGTTDSGNDLWFVGATPFCVAGLWNGYKYPDVLDDDTTVKVTWKAVIEHLLANYDWSGKSWILSENVYSTLFCRSSGKLAGPSCYDTATGWYSTDNAPGTCNGGSDHIAHGKPASSPSPSAQPSTEPTLSPSPSVDPSLSPEPSPGTSSDVSGGDSSLPEVSSGVEPPVSSTPSEDPSTPAPPPPPTEEPTPTAPPTPEPPPANDGEEGGNLIG